jgi:hypothetical protein
MWRQKYPPRCERTNHASAITITMANTVRDTTRRLVQGRQHLIPNTCSPKLFPGFISPRPGLKRNNAAAYMSNRDKTRL